MFVVPCKYTKGSLIIDCVRSLRSFHPNEQIVVVDSSSEDKSYFDDIKGTPNLIVLDSDNKNREFGALRLAYNFNPDDTRYVIVHDTITLLESIDDFLNLDACALMYFPEEVTLGSSQHDYIKRVLGPTQYSSEDLSYLGVFGSMVILSSRMMRRLKEKGMFEAFSPVTKWESEMSERIIGICLKQEGIDLRLMNVEGNFLEKANAVALGNTRYFKKKFMRRE